MPFCMAKSRGVEPHPISQDPAFEISRRPSQLLYSSISWWRIEVSNPNRFHDPSVFKTAPGPAELILRGGVPRGDGFAVRCITIDASTPFKACNKKPKIFEVLGLFNSVRFNCYLNPYNITKTRAQIAAP